MHALRTVDRTKTEELLSELHAAEAKGRHLSEDEFHGLLNKTIDYGIATAERLWSLFKISRPAGDRWQRISAPHPFLRKSVMTGLIKEVQTALQ